MSSTKKSISYGLQRSRSSSSIAVPRLSRLPVRNSMQKNRGKSLSRPGLEKKSLDKNLSRSRSSSHLTLNEIGRQRSGSLLRQTFTTPLNQNTGRPGRKSPLLSSVRKDNRPITDKKWQNEQLLRVRNFVKEEFPHIEYNNIKSGITLDMFVELMHSYFQIIDKRINITRENYIEEVPSHLKSIRYPTAIKPSFMKTVNTPHSWSQVLAILSWLTDIIYELNMPDESLNDLEKIADDCFIELNYYWNIGQDDPDTSDQVFKNMNEKLVNLLNIDVNELENQDKELEKLKQEKVAYLKKQQENQEKIQVLKTRLDDINGKCNQFQTQTLEYEKNMKDQQAVYNNKIKKTDHELTELLKTEELLKATIAAQPHSCTEKQHLVEEIESLQNTVKLKEERCHHLGQLISYYDFQLSDLKQKMEAEAYKYNNFVNELELLNPEYKKLHIRESGFAKMDTENELIEVNKMLILIISKSKEDLEILKKKVENSAEKCKKIEEDFFEEQKELEELIKLDAGHTLDLKHKLEKVALEKEKALEELSKYQNDLLELKGRRFNLEPLEQKLQELKERENDLKKQKDDLKYTALNFFIKLQNQISDSMEQYTKIMSNITNVVQATQEEIIKESEKRLEYLENARANAAKKLKKN